MTVGSSSVLYQLPSPVLIKQYHTLWVERLLTLSSRRFLVSAVSSGYKDGSYLEEEDVLKPRKKGRH